MLTASFDSLLRRIIVALTQEFSMKDHGPLHHFLSVFVDHRASGFSLSQWQYMLDILAQDGMSDYKPTLPQHLPRCSVLILIGLAVLILAAPPLAMQCFWVLIWSLGPLSASSWSPILAHRSGILC